MADFPRESLAADLGAGLEALGIGLAPAARERLLDYLALLARWNRAYNLTAVRDPAAMVRLHLLDSLAILPETGEGRLLDVGAGAGLPGIPLAIARPALAVTLLDTNGKKTRFMGHVVRSLGLANCEVVQSRVEAFEPPACFDTVVSRAFSSLAQMLEWSGHLACRSGKLLAMKGKYPAEELAELPDGYRLEAVRALDVPGLDSSRHLVILRHD